MKSIAIAIGTGLHTVLYAPLKALGYSHPIHPIFVHLTIGTIVAAFIFDYVAWIFGKPKLYTTARHNLVVAFPSYIVTGFVGLADWSGNYQVASLNPSSNPVMFAFGMKFVLSGVLLLLFIAAYFVFKTRREEDLSRHLLYLLLFLNVVGLGFFGGNVIYG